MLNRVSAAFSPNSGGARRRGRRRGGSVRGREGVPRGRICGRGCVLGRVFGHRRFQCVFWTSMALGPRW